ncbi:hypothetical protein BLNAU_3758 [Blattamonas nauphoetae]|uniref:Uncharacterized protein n=1 Tax=Blattamonas nauphoetae TaxID=2049346 RepID=A0ABQ9YC37_9EUKA|nr:hypothetical protein BLNAU_3758 [Blattamonas nauphoetae]
MRFEWKSDDHRLDPRLCDRSNEERIPKQHFVVVCILLGFTVHQADIEVESQWAQNWITVHTGMGKVRVQVGIQLVAHVQCISDLALSGIAPKIRFTARGVVMSVLSEERIEDPKLIPSNEKLFRRVEEEPSDISTNMAAATDREGQQSGDGACEVVEGSLVIACPDGCIPMDPREEGASEDERALGRCTLLHSSIHTLCVVQPIRIVDLAVELAVQMDSVADRARSFRSAKDRHLVHVDPVVENRRRSDVLICEEVRKPVFHIIVEEVRPTGQSWPAVGFVLFQLHCEELCDLLVRRNQRFVFRLCRFSLVRLHLNLLPPQFRPCLVPRPIVVDSCLDQVVTLLSLVEDEELAVGLHVRVNNGDQLPSAASEDVLDAESCRLGEFRLVVLQERSGDVEDIALIGLLSGEWHGFIV